MSRRAVDERPQRPRYQTIRSIDEIPADADVVEQKIDGQWCMVEVGERDVILRSRMGGIIKTWEDDHCRSAAGSTLVGEYDEFDVEVVVFDCVRAYGCDIGRLPLSFRRKFAAALVGAMGDGYSLIEQFPVSDAPRLWSDYVVGGDAEGLVFKRSSSIYGTPWTRIKRVAELDFVCLGFQEAVGRREGRGVGSIEAGLFVNGKLTEVQLVGNMRDDEAEDMYSDPDRFIGKAFRATGQEINEETGTLRHASFDCWRFDKPADECIKGGS